METKQTTLTIINAEEGKYLTQASEDVELMARTVASEIALGEGVTPDSYKEIDTATAKAILAAQKQQREEDLKRAEPEARGGTETTEATK